MEVRGWKEKMRDIDSTEDWLQRKPKLTQGCSANWLAGWQAGRQGYR
jgi:hypothetical protein